MSGRANPLDLGETEGLNPRPEIQQFKPWACCSPFPNFSLLTYKGEKWDFINFPASYFNNHPPLHFTAPLRADSQPSLYLVLDV